MKPTNRPDAPKRARAPRAKPTNSHESSAPVLNSITGRNPNVQSSASDEPPIDNPKPKRLSISLSADAAELLESLSEEQGVSLSEVIRRALATEAYIQREIQQGSRILIQKADEQIREVIFR